MGVVDAPLVISTPSMLYATGTRSSRACSSGRTLPATASAMSLYPFAREKAVRALVGVSPLGRVRGPRHKRHRGVTHLVLAMDAVE